MVKTCSLTNISFRFIDYCDINQAYRGTERMTEDDEIEDLIQRLAAVELIDGVYYFFLCV